MAPGRTRPGRPRLGEPSAASRKRTFAVPLDMDAALQRLVEARGISIQAALREAVDLWLKNEAKRQRV